MTTAPSLSLRLEAAREILDRGLGRPKVAVDLDATVEDRRFDIRVTDIIVDPDRPEEAERLIAQMRRGDPVDA